ncbi:MAG: PBP1A family penicillin-binding protein [Deltaproteobacteria bacterium]|nr:PBP1A family penicillin-binding protein [Deltaproteobacteria bacterium]
MIRRYLLLSLAVALLLHIGYLYFKVGRGVAGDAWESPSILYGRPTEIRKGDHLGNLRFAERLQRLHYRKVAGKPSTAGTFSEERGNIRIFPRVGGTEKSSRGSGPVDIAVHDGRVVSLVSPAGGELDSIRLEPEEIGRIMGPKMESRRPVPLSAISPFLQNAVIASEDARFYSHIGIDVLATGRALFTNFKQQRFAQGGSTITQQLAKNFFLSPKKTLGRKLREVELALMLEWRYSKKQILEMYLNKIYFGQEGLRGIYGIEEAAEFYFSKQARDISLEESALLAGIIRSPNRYPLLRAPTAVKKRRNAVLARMRQLEMIREDEFQRALSAPVQTRQRSAPVYLASHFVDYLRRITAEELGGEKLYRTGYRYYTTLDPIHQAVAQEAVTRGLEEIEKTATPAGEPLQAALVAVDPATGAMTAMVGGRGHGDTRFNRAVDAKRQPGSAFKPFVLLTALSLSAQGKGDKTLSTIVSGEPVSIPTPEGMWTPSNFERKTYGTITIRKMIEDSVNTATARLANDIGLEEVLKTARAAGITSPLLPVPSMALGSFEVTPVELAYAYTTIASGGIRFDPFPLFSVTTADGDILTAKKVHREQALDQRVAYLTGYAMEGVLERGTANSAKAMGISFPASGKTGTTNGNRDSWFVGYTPDVVCAVWVGNDSGADTGLTGAQGALHLWARFLRALYPQSGPPALTRPEGVETAVIDPESGYLATTSCPQTLQEAYLTGTAPKETCPYHPVHPVVETLRKGIQSVGDFFRNLFR